MKKNEIVSNLVKERAPEISVNELGNIVLLFVWDRACRILSDNVQSESLQNLEIAGLFRYPFRRTRGILSRSTKSMLKESTLTFGCVRPSVGWIRLLVCRVNSKSGMSHDLTCYDYQRGAKRSAPLVCEMVQVLITHRRDAIY
jgi:hypothetical protein